MRRFIFGLLVLGLATPAHSSDDETLGQLEAFSGRWKLESTEVDRGFHFCPETDIEISIGKDPEEKPYLQIKGFLENTYDGWKHRHHFQNINRNPIKNSYDWFEFRVETTKTSELSNFSSDRKRLSWTIKSTKYVPVYKGAASANGEQATKGSIAKEILELENGGLKISYESERGYYNGSFFLSEVVNRFSCSYGRR